MKLSSLRRGELKEVFDALEEAFAATNVDFYVIGAMATNIWYAGDGKIGRETKDVDFAVLISTDEEYKAVKIFLRDNKSFIETKANWFEMRSPTGVQVDILPFGGIEIDEGVHVDGEGLTSINVNGFLEVFNSGTEEVAIETGHQFSVATLPAIVLLKLIAFDDRPEKRFKDARDIAEVIEHYFHLQAELIYFKHVDLFSEPDDDQSLPEISAIVIGREMRDITGNNAVLKDRIKQILGLHIEQKDDSSFIRNMASETGGTVKQMVKYLENICKAFQN
ncbi:MAG: hypothetical protein NVS1B13_08390 [Flavisolibacter sp.]